MRCKARGASIAEAAEPFLGVMHAPGCDGSDRHHRQREAEAEGARPARNPRTTCFTWRHTSKMVNAAGHGMSPPVMPKSTICGVVTVRLAKRLRDVLRMGALVGVLILDAVFLGLLHGDGP